MVGSSGPRDIPFIARAEDAAHLGRLRRRVASTNLLVLGVAAAAIALGWIYSSGSDPALGLLGLSIPISFTVLAVLMSFRSNRIGMRQTRVGYSLAALISVLAVIWVFPIAAAIGPLTILGLGFAVFGWRERCQSVWVSGLAGVLVGFVTTAEPMRAKLGLNTVDGAITIGIATATFALTVITLGIMKFAAESNEMTKLG